MEKSDRVSSEEALEIIGANSGGARDEDEEEYHHQSDLATCGLLRIDDKLWLLAAAAASEFDLVNAVGDSLEIASSNVYLPD